MINCKGNVVGILKVLSSRVQTKTTMTWRKAGVMIALRFAIESGFLWGHRWYKIM